MKKIILDTDIILDIALERREFIEDAVQVETAILIEIDAIITRNDSDFEHSGLQVYTPDAFIQKHKVSG